MLSWNDNQSHRCVASAKEAQNGFMTCIQNVPSVDFNNDIIYLQAHLLSVSSRIYRRDASLQC
eukprot:m.1223102 g.1223102  ORF g.1223102 m.1223102 type:complete len:63 (-) comp24625_c0_seq11:557-745(-)